MLPVFTRLLDLPASNDYIHGMPFLSAMLFTVHPIHVESVSAFLKVEVMPVKIER